MHHHHSAWPGKEIATDCPLLQSTPPQKEWTLVFYSTHHEHSQHYCMRTQCHWGHHSPWLWAHTHLFSPVLFHSFSVNDRIWIHCPDINYWHKLLRWVHWTTSWTLTYIGFLIEVIKQNGKIISRQTEEEMLIVRGNVYQPSVRR